MTEPAARPRSAPLHVLQKLVVSLTVVTFLYAGQITCWSGQWNRYFRQWQRADGLAIAVGIVLLTLAATAAAVLIDFSALPRLQEAGRLVFLLALTAGASSTLAVHAVGFDISARRDWVSALCWALVLPVLVWWRRPLARIGTKLCLIFSPLVVILSWQLLTWKAWETQRGSPPVESAGVQASTDDAERTASPVFVFVFDEWSYVRSVEGSDFLPSLGSLRSLGRQSVVFSQALSPADETRASLPRLIYQQAGDLLMGEDAVWWRYRGRTRRSDAVPSLFRLAHDRGYRTVLYGFYHAYPAILGSQLDAAWTYAYHVTYDGLAAKTVAAALYNLRFWTDPVSRVAWRELYRHALSSYWVDISHDIQRRTEELIDSCPMNTFAFFHWPLPHDPYVFRADGTYAGPFRERPSDGTAEQYMQQVCYADKVLGDLLDRLHRSGKFDRAMIIVTSDHSWRYDADPDFRAKSEGDRRVPLLIKLPGQKTACRIDARFNTVGLKPLFQAVFGGQSDAEKLIELVRRIVASPGANPGASGRQPVAARDPGHPGPAR